MNHSSGHISETFKREAKKQGFDQIGFAKAGFLKEEASKLEQWLKNDFHGEMGYMANHFEKRLDPTKLEPGTKSVVSLAYNYFPENELDTGDYKISKYAYGKDYHKVIKKKLKSMISNLHLELGEFQYRFFVDSAPVMERQWAQKSGLGWLGKNSLLISPKKGSFFFLAEILTDLEFDYDNPVNNYCGTCNRCIEACPTDAIPQPYLVDASKCISYLTIELRSEMPTEFKDKYKEWIFGCDICQDVCPWNKFSKQHQTPEFKPSTELNEITGKELEVLDEEEFSELFKGSAIKRTKLSGLRRNIEFIKKPR